MKRALLLAALVVASSACVAPPADEHVSAPATIGTTRVLVGDSATEVRRKAARQSSVRVRAVSCDGVATGSGFLLDDRRMVTNRHVIAGAYKVDVETWDGSTLSLRIVSSANIADLGIVTLASEVPSPATLAEDEAAPGDDVYAAGYPLGDAFTLTSGHVVDVVDNPGLGNSGDTIRMNAEIHPGNSGGALLDNDGQVVAVVYAIEKATGLGLAIPVSRLKSVMANPSAFAPVKACE